MMIDSGWAQFVADWCTARGIVDADSVERLTRTETYMLAEREWLAGARREMVIGLLVLAGQEAGVIESDR